MKIIVKVPIEGIHYYENAPDEVDYLRYPHRHTFTIEAHKVVTHDNRETEFIMFQHQIRDWANQCYYDPLRKLCNFGPFSCEQIAKDVKAVFNCEKVIVWEDNEFGGEA